MPTTTGMKGAGYYDRHSTAQQSAIRALQDWVDAAVADILLPARDEPVTVLDLGSSEGGNAIRLMASIVAGLRRRTDQPLRTIYSDLPSNDFNRLFANLEEVRGAGRTAHPTPSRSCMSESGTDCWRIRHATHGATWWWPPC